MAIKRKNFNILVTGGLGFMGSAFIRHVLSKKEFLGSIYNLDLMTYAGNKENLTHYDSDYRYKFFQGDISNRWLIESICKKYHIDTIVHFAAQTHVDRSISSPSSFIDTNINGTFSLLEVVRNNPGIHFHHISTDEVYGSLGKDGFFTEGSRYFPNSPYSASKAAADHLVRSYNRTYGLSTTISHASNNYGPCQYPEKLIPLLITNCLKNKPLPIYGEGKNIRDWLYVDDHASAIWRIIQEGVSGEVYDIGGCMERTNREVVSSLIKILSQETKQDEEHFNKLITYVKDRPGHDYRYAIDSSKMRNNLLWRPLHTFDEGLKKTVRWYLFNRRWLENVFHKKVYFEKEASEKVGSKC